MQSTVKIFRYLYNNLPPLFPEDIALRMKASLDNVEGRADIPLEKIEDMMINFGYEVWPWNQAHKEFMASAERKLGEHFLAPQLSPGLANKYDDFRALNGTFEDLRTGRPAEFFTAGERIELCHALIDVHVKLREYVAREVTGIARRKYMVRVAEFKGVLERIREHIESLRQLVNAETDHSMLVREITDKIRHFEHGLCLLAPDLQYEAVCRSHEFFCGRKLELGRMRGIHVPAQIDFYNS